MTYTLGDGREELGFLARLASSTGRRTFLKWSGITIAVAAVGCDDDDGGDVTTPPPTGSVSLGSGDTAVLNYAYALEQLEAAFYNEAVTRIYRDVTAEETQILTAIGAHEVAHRDFFRAALAGNAIGTLTFDFTSINFGNRDEVLEAARTFEDLGVSAYNGAGVLISTPANLTTAGKIVSVEARHAAVIRNLLEPGTGAFANQDVLSPTGLDQARTPSDVLDETDDFITETIDASALT
jgi:hypothetical protein